MSLVVLILIGSQILFSLSDFMGRKYMAHDNFAVASFLSVWFLIYFVIRIFATFGQLYVFSRVELGPTITMFAAAGIIAANLIGFIFLKEVLTTTQYVGVSLTLSAFLIMAFR